VSPKHECQSTSLAGLSFDLTDGFVLIPNKAQPRQFADRDHATTELRKQLLRGYQTGELKKA